MSTKIYNGYRIHPKDRGFDGVWRFMMGAMKRIRSIGERKAEVQIVERAIRAFDVLRAGYKTDLGRDDGVFKTDPKAHIGIAIALASSEFQDHAMEVKKTQQRDPLYDMSFEAVVLRAGKDVLVITYTENRELEKIWAKTKGVEYYGFWDNTDPDEDCSAKEWDARRKAWNEALGGEMQDSPAQSGMTVQAIPIGWSSLMGMWGFRLGHAKKLALSLEKKMTIDERARNVAKNRLVGLRFCALTKGIKNDELFEKGGFSKLREAEEWVRKNPKAVDKLSAKIKPKLQTVEEMFAAIPKDFGERE